MKNILAIAVVLVLGVVAWMYLGGSIAADRPTENPLDDISPPDPNDLAEGTKGGADWLADWLTGRSAIFWQIAVVLIGTAIVAWLWKNKGWFKGAVVAILTIIFIFAFIV